MANRDLQTNESIKSLKSKVRSERNGNVRDRIRAIVMAVKGLKDREIGDKLGYSIHWVRKWIGRYKKAGIDGLQDGLRTGQPMLLTDEQIFVLYDEILAGPDPSSVLSLSNPRRSGPDQTAFWRRGFIKWNSFTDEKNET
ncbi:MAG: helix-turn-helix domain-containing protein [Bdellovibrionales bacterium]|nr:helix-turn-helix domain-containing protein [Bdellovibrionales bacterium]